MSVTIQPSILKYKDSNGNYQSILAVTGSGIASGAPETITGTTPSITGQAGIRYICGECATLTIAPPAIGDIEVIFESGTTATVLTITPPTGITAVKWPAWFDSTDLDVNCTYDIIITNGEFGVVTSWT